MCIKNVLFNLQIFGDFFSAIFLLVISSLIPLWTENILCMVSVLLNLLKFVLWPRMWSFFINVHACLRGTCILLQLDGAFCKFFYFCYCIFQL